MNIDFDIEQFEKFTYNFSSVFHNIGTRQKLKHQIGDNFTTQLFDKNFILFAHSESSYIPDKECPETAFFYCKKSANGGATTLVNGIIFYDLIPSQIKRRLEQGVWFECLWNEER